MNDAATELLRQPRTKASTLDDEPPDVGDAVLVTDHREHCSMQPTRGDYTSDDLEFFATMLTTPHSVIIRGNPSLILFHEEPNEIDIIGLTLSWS
jgi:hypothetical protein